MYKNFIALFGVKENFEKKIGIIIHEYFQKVHSNHSSFAILLIFLNQNKHKYNYVIKISNSGITINAVCPSQTMTDMLKNSMTDSELRSLCKNIPLGRIASTSEQAFPILFLCSNEASYITGAIIDVNGGQLW